MAPLRRGKPVFVKLHRVAPASRDNNVVVAVLQKAVVVDKLRADGTRVREERVLVADETGSMELHARGDLCEKLVVGETVALHNAKVVLVSNCMRITFDKWGSVKPTPVVIPGEPQREPNFSEVVYGRLDS